MIPRETIDEIRARCDIEEVIGQYVTLKRAGSNFSGLCPFHSEKTPSFTVFPASNSFYCFGCGAGGDAITFVRRAENLDYVEAVELLAKRVGVTIPQDSRGERTRNGMTRQRVYDMNLAAAKFFRSCLFDPAIGGEGMRYLSEERGLSGAVIKRFGLGFAPNSFGVLQRHMNSLGYSDGELIEGFLCGKSQKTGKAYDYFRNRVIFPIIDTAGNVIAFGGRVMDDSKPKYLNSSDTPGFKKSRNLFALNYAKNHCAEQMILCEGYMDVIALHAAGVENAVATLGTAITQEQARLLAKYTKKVIISYDSDGAGQNAAARAMRLLGEVGLEVRVLQMSGAKDPDEYIKKFGVERFRKLLRDSRTGFEFRLNAILARHDLSDGSEKLRACAEICDMIAGVWSGVEREVYIAAAAEKLGLGIEGITSDVNRIRAGKLREYRKKEASEAQASLRNYGDRVNPDSARNLRASAAEETILGLLLIYDEYRALIARGEIGLAAEDFCTEFGRRVFSEIMALQRSEGGYLFELLGQTLSPEEMGRLARLEQKRRMLTENGPAVLQTSIETLRQSVRQEEEKQSSAADFFARKREEMRGGQGKGPGGA
ncbi:MAG: DNA primase [Clostridia bacterium]|nr:DNA primase [Clostridia bacterium]